jgi:hypothetical protein
VLFHHLSGAFCRAYSSTLGRIRPRTLKKGKSMGKVMALALALALGAALGFFAAQSVVFYRFAENADRAAKLEMIDAGLELAEDFYDDDNESFAALREAIPACGELNQETAKDAPFEAEELGKYLGFLDDLGFFYREGALDLAFVDHFFGEPMIEAYENKALKKYLAGLQTKLGSKVPFQNFQTLAQALEQLPPRHDMVETARKRCHAAP